MAAGRYEPNQKRKVFKRAFVYLRPHLRLEAAILGLMVGATLLSLPQPLAVKLLIDEVLGRRNMSLLYVVTLVLLFAFAINAVLTWYLAYLSNLVQQRIQVDVRCKLFDHIHELGPEYYNNVQTGEIMYRVLNDSLSVSGLIATSLSKILTDLLTLVAILSLMLYFDWRLSLVGLASLPVFALTLTRFNGRIRKANFRISQENSWSSAVLAEAIGMLKYTQMFCKQGYMAERFRSRLNLLTDASVNATMIGTAAGLVSGFFAFAGPLSVLVYGSVRVIHGDLSTGTLVAFYSYIVQLYGPIGSLANINAEVQSAYAGLSRVFEILDTRPRVMESADPLKISDSRGALEFKDVSFTYPGRESVLRGITFRVEPGEKVAFVGQSGAGKSTIVDLLSRFYDPIDGAVLFDGQDLRDLELKSLRRQIAIVSQDTFLFDDSLFDNIAFGGNSPTQGEVEAAAKVANIHDFIVSLPEGYQTLVGERGVRLSGGQRQRIAIARAILRNARVVVLDEATSSVDTIGERMIRDELDRLIEGRTAIIIAHRMSAIQGADRIFVIEDGAIVATGTHEALLGTNPLYRELFFNGDYDALAGGPLYGGVADGAPWKA
jgi:ABC-type multidrug transport system fused ATPase/permease subunit